MIKTFLKSGVAAGSSVFLFVLLVAAARVLGPLNFGRFAFALAFVLLLDPVLDPGFFRLLVRKVRERESGSRYLLHALTWKAVAVPVLFVVIRLVVPHIDPSDQTMTAVLLIGASQVLKSMKESVRAMFIAGDSVGRELLTQGVERLALMLAGLVALQTGGGLKGLCLAFVLVRLLDLGLAWALVRNRLGEISFRLEPRFLWTMFVSGVPVAAYYVTANFYSYLDTVMLAAMRTQIEVGHYTAAHRIYEGVSILPLIICTALMPKFAGSGRQGALPPVFAGGLKYAFGLGALAAFNGFVAAPAVMRMFFGGGYEPSIGALRILVAGFPAVFALQFINAALLSTDRLKPVVGYLGAGLALNGLLNLFLIPRYSLNGAAAATVAAEAILFGVLYVRLRKSAAGIAAPMFGALTVSAALAFGAAWFAARWGSVLQLVAGNAMFIGAALFLGFVGDREQRALVEAVERVRRRLKTDPGESKQ